MEGVSSINSRPILKRELESMLIRLALVAATASVCGFYCVPSKSVATEGSRDD